MGQANPGNWLETAFHETIAFYCGPATTVGGADCIFQRIATSSSPIASRASRCGLHDLPDSQQKRCEQRTSSTAILFRSRCERILHFLASERTPQPAVVLNSWKDIAHYLDRSVRTMQRWELALQLPVNRPRGSKRSVVLAIPAEIDTWLKRTPVRDLETDSRTRAHSIRTKQREWAELRERTVQLCDAVLKSRDQLYTVVSTISATIQKIELARGGQPLPCSR